MSPKTVIIGMGLACLIYVLMIVFTLLNGGNVIEAFEDKMAAQNIAIESAMPLADNDFVEPLENSNSSASHNDSNIADSDLSSLVAASKRAPLPEAPFDGLTEETSYGFLPVIGKNNLKPFKAYQKPFVYDVKKPVIGIGVTGVGLSSDLTEGVFDKLSPQVSIVLSPYASDIDDLRKEARGNGYEVWLEVPMENKDFPRSDPGSKGILANAGLQFNQDNYRSVLAMTSGYAGMAGYTDRAFLDARQMLSGVLNDGFSRGLGFFEMNSGRDAISLKMAVNSRAAHIQSTQKSKGQSLGAIFAALKKQATREDQSVAALEISPAMLRDFQVELLKAEEEGFQIVPLSALVDQF